MFLGFLGKCTDLVEQQGSAVGFDHPTDALGECAREGARNMAEFFVGGRAIQTPTSGTEAGSTGRLLRTSV